MSNLGNPNCCCDVGLHYPWLTFETNTFGANMDAAHPNQIVRTPAVSISAPPSPHYLYTYCNFSSGTDDCNSPCYQMPTLAKNVIDQTIMRVEVDEDGCWDDCNDSSCWCDIPKDSTALKHYIDLDYPDVLNWVDQGPVEGGVGSNNAYPEFSIVMYDGIRYMATGEPDDADTPREPPPNRLSYEIDGDFGGWAANTPPLTRHDSVHTLGLRAEGVSYAWHLTQDVRVPFNKDHTYQSGERVYVQWSCASGSNETPDGNNCFSYNFQTDGNYYTSAPMSHYPSCSLDDNSKVFDDWDSSTNYSRGEWVYYKGRDFVWLQSNSSSSYSNPEPDADGGSNFWYPLRFYCERFVLSGSPDGISAPDWTITGTVGPSLFDIKSGWEMDTDIKDSEYTLNLLDWSQPAAWITGEQCSKIASKTLTFGPANNPNNYRDGYKTDNDTNLAGAGWADLGLRESYMADSAALGFPYQGNRVFLHNNMNREFGNAIGRSTTTNRGWGRQAHVSSFIAIRDLLSSCPDALGANFFCKKCGENEPIRFNYFTQEMAGDEKVQTISADGSKYAYFKVEFQSLASNSQADASLYKNHAAADGRCEAAILCGDGRCLMGQRPHDEGYNRYKVYLQQWDRDGDSITYSQPDVSDSDNETYPNCRYNWDCATEYRKPGAGKTNDCDGFYFQSSDSSDKRNERGNPHFPLSEYCNRVADIVYFPEEWQIPNAKKIGTISWKGMDAKEHVGTQGSCDEKATYGLVQLETYPQPYAIAPRVPMRGISIQTSRWTYTDSLGSYKDNDAGVEEWVPKYLAPPTCRISYRRCGGGYLDENCWAGKPKQAGFTQGASALEVAGYVENYPGYLRLPVADTTDVRESQGAADLGHTSFAFHYDSDGKPIAGQGWPKSMAQYVSCNWASKQPTKPWAGSPGLEVTEWGGGGGGYSFFDHSPLRCGGYDQSIQSQQDIYWNWEGTYTTEDLCKPCEETIGSFTAPTDRLELQKVIDGCNEYWYGVKSLGSYSSYYEEDTLVTNLACARDDEGNLIGNCETVSVGTSTLLKDAPEKPNCIGGVAAKRAAAIIGSVTNWTCPGAPDDPCVICEEGGGEDDPFADMTLPNLHQPQHWNDFLDNPGEVYTSKGQACIGKYGGDARSYPGTNWTYNSMMSYKFLMKHCGECIDLDGSVEWGADIGGQIGPQRGELDPPVWRYGYSYPAGGYQQGGRTATPQVDSSLRQIPSDCASRRIEQNCTETEDHEHGFKVTIKLVGGTGGVGEKANEGKSIGSENKRFVIKSPTTLFENEFDWTTRVYNWQSQPNHGISLYGYDAGQFGSSKVVDLVAMTTIEATKVSYDYHPHQPQYLPEMVGWPTTECVVKNWECTCVQNGGSYGEQSKFFEKDELHNRLIIGDSDQPMYEYNQVERDGYDCSKKYNVGDIVVYSGCWWSAKGRWNPEADNGNGAFVMPDPAESVDNDPQYDLFECTNIYYKGNQICHVSPDNGNYYTYTFIDDFTHQGVDPFDRCKQYRTDEFPQFAVCNPFVADDGSTKYHRYNLKETTPNPKGIWATPYDCTATSYTKAELVRGVDGQVWECVLEVSNPEGECLELPSGIPTFNGMHEYIGGPVWQDSTTYSELDQVRTTGHNDLTGYRYSGVFMALKENTNKRPGETWTTTDGEDQYFYSYIDASDPYWTRVGDIQEVLHYDGIYGKVYVANKNVLWGDCGGTPTRNPEPIIDFIRRGGRVSEYMLYINSCPFNTDDWDWQYTVNWNPVGYAADCDNGCYTKDCSDPQCCDFNEDHWNVVTADGSPDGSPKVYNCCGRETCCEFVYDQWEQGPLCDQCPDDCCPFDPDIWEQQEECRRINETIDQHWYNTYYHRDTNDGEHTASPYDPTATYNFGDKVKHSGYECGWLVDRFYTYQATGSFDPIGEFDHSVWTQGITGDDGANTSEADTFEIFDYPNMYPYNKYERVVYDNKLWEAYPFYCTDLDLNKSRNYGNKDWVRDPQPMVVADADGKIRSDPDHGTLFLWVLDPTIEFTKCVKSWSLGYGPDGLPEPATPHSCWKVVAHDDWEWRGENDPNPNSFPGGKWRKVGTDEDTVRPPVDRYKLRVLRHESLKFTGKDYGLYRYTNYTDFPITYIVRDNPNGGGANAGRTYRVGQLQATDECTDFICCPPPSREQMCQRTWDPLYQAEISPEKFGPTDRQEQLAYQCIKSPGQAFLNPNFGGIDACVLLNGGGFKDRFGDQYVPDAQVCSPFEYENWRCVAQPEFFNKNDRKEFHPLADLLLNDPSKSCDAGFPPNTTNGAGCENDISQIGLIHDTLCPALHVVTESEGGGALAAATPWNSFLDYGDLERSGVGQQFSYTYLELTKDSEGNDEWTAYEINKPRHVVNWKLQFYDTSTDYRPEVGFPSAPSLYSLNEPLNMAQGRCAIGYPDSYGAEHEPCWGYVEKEYGVKEGSRYWSPNDFQYEKDEEDKNRLKESSWRPWMEWSSDRWVYLYNFPLTTKTFQQSAWMQLSTSVHGLELLAMTGTNWPEIERHYPSYIPPAKEVYNKNKLLGYQYTGVLPGAVYTGTPSDPGIQPKPFRVIHDGLDYTVLSTSEVAADTWRSSGPEGNDINHPGEGTNNAYPTGSVVQHGGNVYLATALNDDAPARSAPDSDTTHWEAVTTCSPDAPTYNASYVYPQGSLVSHDDKIWRAKEDVGSPVDKWTHVGPSVGGVGDYNAYPVGSKVYTEGGKNTPENGYTAVQVDDIPNCVEGEESWTESPSSDSDPIPPNPGGGADEAGGGGDTFRRSVCTPIQRPFRQTRKTYPDGQYRDMGPPLNEGSVEFRFLGVGENNAYPIGTQVIWNSYCWEAVGIDDEPLPRVYAMEDGQTIQNKDGEKIPLPSFPDSWQPVSGSVLWGDFNAAPQTVPDTPIVNPAENPYTLFTKDTLVQMVPTTNGPIYFYKALQDTAVEPDGIVSTEHWEYLTPAQVGVRIDQSSAGGDDVVLWESFTPETAGAFVGSKWESLGAGCTVAGKFNEDNWLQVDNDGYIWRDWMVSHAMGSAGVVWIPIGCRVTDTETDTEKMIATSNAPSNILVNNTHSTIQGSGCSTDFRWSDPFVQSCVFAGQSWGYRNVPAISQGEGAGYSKPHMITSHNDPSNRHRFDVLARSNTASRGDVPLIPPASDHSPKRE